MAKCRKGICPKEAKPGRFYCEDHDLGTISTSGLKEYKDKDRMSWIEKSDETSSDDDSD